AAESPNVLLHPFEGGHLVEQAVVARRMVRRFLYELGVNKETENVGAVIDGDGDHAVSRHILAVVTRFRPITVLESSAKYVHEHGKLLAIRLRRRPYVQ